MFFLVFCNVLTTSIFDLSASAKTDDDAFVSSESSTSANCCNETSGTYLAPETEKRHFAPDENIIVQYSVSTEESIADFSCFYAIKNEYGAFASPFSEDDARERYFDYAIASDIMSLEEF